MPVQIDEVIVQVEPEPTTPPAATQQRPSRDVTVQIVRSQVALLARRAARLRAD
jgi:hypothetical protein